MNDKVLIACEESQTITKAMRSIGIEAYSCDILDCSGGHPEWHIKGDAIEQAYSGKYGMMIAHPECTYLTVTGNKWFYHPEDKDLPIEDRRPHPRFLDRKERRKNAIDFFMKLAEAPIDLIAIENPVGIMSTQYRKPDQIIQPYHFGDPHAKKTCLWTKGLPGLLHTDVVEPEYVTYKSGKRMAKWYSEAVNLPKEERSKLRSKTFQGIADAIANQWGRFFLSELYIKNNNVLKEAS
ncbi:MAG: hypothetical protein F6K19_01605 [Cyanothece sp. SIO1E1]|nr:hypothetical protein [Cyanothece sp. SIO1E1]